MRYFVVGLLVGCGGAESEECEEQVVTVQVTSPAGEPVPEATVDLDDLPCVDLGGGAYECAAPVSDDDYQLFVYHQSYTAFSKILLAEEGCDPMNVAVDLQPPMGM